MNDEANKASRPEHDDPARYIALAGFEGEWRELWWNHDYLELMARRWRLHEVERVLDLGCGAGHWGRTLLPHLPGSARLVGVDKVAAFLEMAEKTADARGLAGRCTYQRAEAEALPFDDASFELVTCQTVLIHVADAARTLAEMRRVLRPGGLIIAAEPDNLAGTMAWLNCSVETSPADVRALIELQQVCERGKLLLGEGDQSIGGRLPGLFYQAGLEDISVYNTDKCARLVPPYANHEERVDLSVLGGWCRERAWFTGGRADSLRTFVAGGGSADEFPALWSRVEAWCDAFLRDVEAGHFHGARGMLHYLVSGRRPAEGA